MNAMICEMCSSQDLVKREGVYVCQHCGTKYTVEEARKLMGTVKIDKTEENQNLLILARRARAEGNSENAEKYYGMLLQADPNNWEAAFFQVYYRAMQCKIRDISHHADAIVNSLMTVSTMVSKANQEEKTAVIKTLVVPCLEIAEMFASAATKHYNEFSTVNGVFDMCVTANVRASVIIGSIELIVKEYCNDKNVLVSVQKHYVSHLISYRKFFNNDYLKQNIARLSNEIRQVDSSYEAPTVSGGCYVATCVYGSYDCPQVWTLRRYRDDTLAATWYGRAFIRTYYAVSPTIVKWFGNAHWFKKLWKNKLDKMVATLRSNGVEDTPYQDKDW